MTRNVSIGICAYNEAARISTLLDSISIQSLPAGLAVAEIIVVASGCTDGTDQVVEERAKADPTVVLIRQPERRGKASAINLILKRFQGDILVLVNADARLRPGALAPLLQPFLEDPRVDVACGFPHPIPSLDPVLDLVERVWWRLHNRTLQTLSNLGRGNHCCDEFMAVRRGFVDSIPEDIVNDGSYFGVLASLRGTTVRSCPDAVVVVETPSHLSGLVQQRRRILSGHRQVRDVLGREPPTLEGLVRAEPRIAAKILLAEFAGNPTQTSLFLGVAGPLEVFSHVLAWTDRVRHPNFQPAWPMVD